MRVCVLLFQAEDGIRGRVRCRELGEVYKRQEGGDRIEKRIRDLHLRLL